MKDIVTYILISVCMVVIGYGVAVESLAVVTLGGVITFFTLRSMIRKCAREETVKVPVRRIRRK